MYFTPRPSQGAKRAEGGRVGEVEEVEVRGRGRGAGGQEGEEVDGERTKSSGSWASEIRPAFHDGTPGRYKAAQSEQSKAGR